MSEILVTGATGNTGSILVPALLEAGENVRVFVRDAEKARTQEEAGAEVIVGDLDDPETIEPAVEGVDRIYLLTWNGPTQVEHVKNVLSAAKQAGNPHIVRHSAWGSENSRLIDKINKAEEIIKSSGLPWTIVKPTFFMQNLLMTVPTIQSEGRIYWDMGDAELSMIDVRDIAESAVAVLTEEGHEGREYILTGPEAISMNEVAETLSEVLDMEISYVPVPTEAANQTRMEMGLSEWITKGYGELMEGFREGFAESTTDNVKKLTGHPARSIKQFAEDFEPYFKKREAVAQAQ